MSFIRKSLFTQSKAFCKSISAVNAGISWANHTIIRAAFVCLCVCGCVPYLLRGPLTDLRQTWWVYVGGPPICPWGVLFRKGQWVNGSLSLSTILYRDQPHTTQLRKTPFALVPQLQSLIRRLLLLHINGICRWTSQLLKGRRVNGSNGSTGNFHFHFIIYDSRRRQAHATPLQKAHGLNGWTGQWVHRSTGQTGGWVNGSLSLSLYYIWSQATPGSPHPAAKSTRRIMTPGSRHTAAKCTQRLLLARRVNFLVYIILGNNCCIRLKVPKQGIISGHNLYSLMM